MLVLGKNSCKGGSNNLTVTGRPFIILKISEKINASPEELNLHKTIVKILNNRKESVKNGFNIDWSTAEALAFGSLLEEGYPVRLVGQDSGRGTFSQRHSVLRNQKDNSRYVPLNNISETRNNLKLLIAFYLN